jgi:hypothetical protein
MVAKLLLISFTVLTLTLVLLCQTIIVAKVDPKLHLPQMLLNFVIKNLAGVILYLFQCQVEKVRG